MDLLEYEGENETEEEVWALLDLEPDHRAQIEHLRPPRPFWISSTDTDAMTRWAYS
ncbi:MAG: hypothetical protein ACXW0R_14440 [Gaiellaceae bacterium]